MRQMIIFNPIVDTNYTGGFETSEFVLRNADRLPRERQMGCCH